MVGLFRTLQKDWKVRLLEVPTRRRLAVGLQRSAKYGLAAIFYYSGLTGLLLGKLLHAGKRALILGYHGVSDSPPILLSRGHALQNVEALLRFLSRHLPCFPLSRIAGALQNGEAPPRQWLNHSCRGRGRDRIVALPRVNAVFANDVR